MKSKLRIIILKKVSSLIVLCAKYNDVLPSLINNHRKKEWFQLYKFFVQGEVLEKLKG